MTSRLHATLSIAIALGTTTFSAALLAAVFEPLALTAQSAPGVPGATFEPFDAVIAANGDIAFRGVLTGAGVNTNNDVGIWVARNGGLVKLVAREGDQPPGYPVGDRFLTLDAVSISDAGESFFNSRILRASEFVQWRGGPDNLAIVSREGQPTPGAVPAVPMYRTVGLPLLAGGNVAFIDSNGLPAQRIWSGPPVALKRVIQVNDAAPGIGGGVTIESLVPVFGFSRITANSQASVAFNAELAGPGVFADNNDVAMFLAQQSGTSLVARAGDQAPGVEAGAVFQILEDPVINANNQVAFRAQLRNTNPFQDSTGLWVGAPGALTLATRSGSPAPGALGRTFATLHPPVLDASGRLAYFALLNDDGGNEDYGLWVGTPGSLQMIIGPGLTLPGTPAGLEFRNFVYADIDRANGPLMNSRGDVVFHAQLAPPGAGPGLAGVWAYVDGVVHKVAMEGDMIDVNADPTVSELKEVASVFKAGGTGGSDGRRSSLNDARQLALEFLFTDGSRGVFRTTLVPEPSALAIFVGAMVSAPLRRVRRRA